MKTKEEEIELVRKALKDPAAMTYLRKDMEFLAGKIADKYSEYGISREELIRIGMSSFDRALGHFGDRIKKWDEGEEEPFKFSTYFTWWIRKRIHDRLNIKDNED